MIVNRKNGNFPKIEANFKKRHPDLVSKYEKTVLLLGQDWQHPSLRLHRVKKYFSVSINMQWRITLDFVKINNELVLLDIHDHKY